MAAHRRLPCNHRTQSNRVRVRVRVGVVVVVRVRVETLSLSMYSGLCIVDLLGEG